MRILLVTALFPPDVAKPAPYVKELAARLAPEHTTTVLTYGQLPEAVDGVRIETVSKQLPLWRRLLAMREAIWSLAHEHDVVIVNNAPSTELPAWAASWYVKTRWFLLASDTKITYTGWKKIIHQVVRRRLQPLALAVPTNKPERHPFRPVTPHDWQQWEQQWEQHLTELMATCSV